MAATAVPNPAAAQTTRGHKARHLSQGITWGGMGAGTVLTGVGMLLAFESSGPAVLLTGFGIFNLALIVGPSTGNFYGGNTPRGLIFTSARLLCLSAAWTAPFTLGYQNDEAALAVVVIGGLSTLTLAIVEIATMERNLERRAKRKSAFASRIRVAPTLISGDKVKHVPGAVIKATW